MVSQFQKSFQVSYMLADIDHLIMAIAFDLLFHIGAIRTRAHPIYFYHNCRNYIIKDIDLL